MFDIHKVKPIHGWREFFGEVGIIVLGVLIALAFEQAVEAVSWRHKVGEAKDAIRAELAEQDALAVKWRMAAPCVESQIGILRHRLLASGNHLSPAPLLQVPGYYKITVIMPDITIASEGWQSALADGVVPHFQKETRSELAAAYSAIHSLDEMNVENEAATRRLLSLATPLKLDPSARLSLLNELDQLDARVDAVQFLSGQLLGDIARAGMSPGREYIQKKNSGIGVISYCKAHGLPLTTLDEAMATIAQA